MKKHTQTTQSNSGWISVHRKFLESEFWTCERFTKGQAWVDIIGKANHKKTKIIIGMKTIVLERGQFLTSQMKLADRWKWNRKTVKSFFNLLENEEMITTKTDRDIQHGYTVVTVLNYDTYQQDGQQDGQGHGQQRDRDTDTNNNDNNVNNDNNITDEESSEELKEKNKQIGECIKAFEPLNPSYKILYNRKPQREAMGLLIEQYGFEKMLEMIQALPKILNDRYAPIITSPYQLREKMGNLIQFIKNKQTPNGKKGGVYDARNV